MVRRVAVALLAVMCISSSAWALGPLDASADISVMSRYVWRGMTLIDDPVFQPSASVGFGGFTVGVWGNMDLTDIQNDAGELNEIDYSLDYTLDLPLASVTLGVSRYDYSITGWIPTTEAYLSVESGIPGNPAITIYQDVDEVDGTYVELGAGQSVPVMPFANLELSALLGWGSEKHNEYNYGITGMKSGFTDFSVSAEMPFGIGNLVSVSPSVTLVSPVNSDIRDTYDKFIAVFGISASAEF